MEIAEGGILLVEDGVNREHFLAIKKLTIDMKMHAAKWDDQELGLTRTEFKLLAYMVQNKNIVLTREQILNHVWGYDYFGETNIVDVYMVRVSKAT